MRARDFIRRVCLSQGIRWASYKGLDISRPDLSIIYKSPLCGSGQIRIRYDDQSFGIINGVVGDNSFWWNGKQPDRITMTKILLAL